MKTLIWNIIALTLIATALPVSAETREWRSADASRSIKGNFVKRDAASVTILRTSDLKSVRIPLTDLFAEDRSWLDTNHPVSATSGAAGNTGKVEASPDDAVFDQLIFGDSYDTVLKKLRASKLVEGTMAETFMARVGLNGFYRTRQKFGNLDTTLYFDWDENKNLKSVTLQSSPVPASGLNDVMTPCWKAYLELLTNLYGQPKSSAPTLSIANIADGGISYTHCWKLPTKGSALLGAAHEGNQYHVCICFTTKEY